MPLSKTKKTNPKNPARSNTAILKGFVQLLRPLNGIMSMIGVYIGYSLSVGIFTFNPTILYAMLAVFFISGGGQAINDYFDYEIDRKRKSNRPLANQIISKKTGLVYSLGLFGIGILLASYINDISLYIAGFFSLLLILYSSLMQEIKFVGNVIVSLSVAFTYIFGSAANQITPLVLMIAIPAFFANWGREIIKDVEDQNEDKGYKLTLPLVAKEKHVQYFTFFILLLGLITGYLPLYFGYGKLVWFGLLVTISNIVFVWAGKELSEKNFQRSSIHMKQGMMTGLLAQLSLLVG